jgi:hypothetical protein
VRDPGVVRGADAGVQLGDLPAVVEQLRDRRGVGGGDGLTLLGCRQRIRARHPAQLLRHRAPRATVRLVADLVYVVFLFLTLALLVALLAPPPARTPVSEAGIHVTLLCAGCVATILTGSLALADLAAPAAVCGVAAWLLVMPCVWLARAPRLDESSGEEEDEDDGGGSPRPLWPSAPPAPDDRPDGLRPTGSVSTGARWAPAPARAPALVPTATATAAAAPVACSAQPPAEPAVAAAAPATEPAGEPAQRRLRRPARPVRGDHRSIVHVQRAGGTHEGRRRRANLRRRFLRTCRRVLWVETPTG